MKVRRPARKVEDHGMPLLHEMNAARNAQDAPSWWTPRRLSLLITSFLAVGVAARVTRYLLRFPLWEDEAALAYNLMQRGFIELLAPLDFGQSAPIGYLWLQRGIVGVLGFSELSIRLSSLVMGLGSLFLFWRVAGLTLPRFAQLFAVSVFAVSYPMIRYSAEAKQYGTDLFLALCAAWFLLEATRSQRGWPWLWLMMLLAAFGPFLSHPFAFAGGAVSLLMLGDLWWKRTTPVTWASWIAYNVLLVSSFLAHLVLAHRALGAGNADYLESFWSYTFPPVRAFWNLPAWFVATHTGHFLAFPLGSGNGGSTLTFLGVALGVIVWARQRRVSLLALALMPAFLHFVAAALHRFPYGGHVKFSMYWLPFACLLLGSGMATALAWLDRRRLAQPRGTLLALGLLACIALGIMGRDFLSPTKTLSDQRSRDFVRWFWNSSAGEEVTVCLHTDLARCFNEDWTGKPNWAVPYYCNLHIYSPRHARRQAPKWSEVSESKPLRCVEYRLGEYAYDAGVQKAWLEDMQRRYDLVSHDHFPMPRMDKHERRHICTDYIEVYKFVPKSGLALAQE
jgi:hypothetical protein